MPYKITEDCAGCGSCETECPNKAISEGESIYKIDPSKCTECVGSYPSPRCDEVCPVDACVPDDKHKESHDKLLAKWKKLHPGETPKWLGSSNRQNATVSWIAMKYPSLKRGY